MIQQTHQLHPNELLLLVEESEREGHTFVRRLVEEWQMGVNRFALHGEAFFVAREDDKFVGVCGLNCDPYTNNIAAGRIRHLYVAANYRRQGIATALLSHVIAHARNYFSLLQLRTFNPVAAEFYSSRGFQPVNQPNCTHQLELHAF